MKLSKKCWKNKKSLVGWEEKASWILRVTNLNIAKYKVLSTIKTLQDSLTLDFSLVQACHFQKDLFCYSSKLHKVGAEMVA